MEAISRVLLLFAFLHTAACAAGLNNPPLPPPPDQAAEATPSTACVYLALIPVSPLFTLTISDEQCQDVAAQVRSDILAQAAVAGAQVLEDAAADRSPPAASCEPNLVKVCVTFRSFQAGAALQPWVELQAPFWAVLLAGSACPPYLRAYGYQFGVFVGGDGGAPPALLPSCLETRYLQPCDLEYPDFPKCQCTTRRASTPFATIPFLEQAPGRKPNTTLFCFTIARVGPSAPDNPCAKTTTLYKAEIMGSYFRRSSLVAVGLQPAGAPSMKFIKPSWGAKGDSTIKVSSLYWSRKQADGGKICLELDKSTDLNKFCSYGSNTCWISLFDESKHCCPTFPVTLF